MREVIFVPLPHCWWLTGNNPFEVDYSNNDCSLEAVDNSNNDDVDTANNQSNKEKEEEDSDSFPPQSTNSLFVVVECSCRRFCVYKKFCMPRWLRVFDWVWNYGRLCSRPSFWVLTIFQPSTATMPAVRDRWSDTETRAFTRSTRQSTISSTDTTQETKRTENLAKATRVRRKKTTTFPSVIMNNHSPAYIFWLDVIHLIIRF